MFDTATVMKQIAKGDEEAFRLLYEEFGGFVFKIVSLSIRDAGKAEELAQDIFLKVWRFASKYDPTRPFKPWLSRVISNEVISYQRTLKEAMASIEEMSEVGYTPGEDMDDYRERSQEADIAKELDEALNKLTDNQRQVVVLKFYQGQKIREIADSLGIGESAVKARLYSSLEVLSELINKCQSAKE